MADRWSFEGSEGLRSTLNRLHDGGPDAWRRDREAAALMLFAGRRYAALAAKYGQTADDAATAAFEAMRNRSTRTAADPWAVVTVAVRITLIAEHRAHGLLTSTNRARRPQYSQFHDVERFSDRETELADYHPAFHIPAPDHLPASEMESITERAIDGAVDLLWLLGWDEGTARSGVEYICARLTDLGDRTTAHEALRRDKGARALLDLPLDSWTGLVRIVLGHKDGRTSARRRGLLTRLLIGDTLTDLLSDDDLVHTAATACPTRRRTVG